MTSWGIPHTWRRSALIFHHMSLDVPIKRRWMSMSKKYIRVWLTSKAIAKTWKHRIHWIAQIPGKITACYFHAVLCRASVEKNLPSGPGASDRCYQKSNAHVLSAVRTKGCAALSSIEHHVACVKHFFKTDDQVFVYKLMCNKWDPVIYIKNRSRNKSFL